MAKLVPQGGVRRKPQGLRKVGARRPGLSPEATPGTWPWRFWPAGQPGSWLCSEPAWGVSSSLPSTDAGPGFELKIELYSAALEEDSALGATPKKLASRLSSSLGRSSGKQLRAALDGSSSGSNGGCSPLLLPPAPSTA